MMEFALHMTEALRVADHAGIEELAGLVLRDGAGNDAPAGIFAVEHDLHVARGLLMAVGEQALGDDALGILAADDLRVALGGVDAADLHGVHLDARALLQIHDGLGIHNVFAVAVSLAVMLLGVVDMGIFADVEGVYAVMAALVAAGVVDAAAGDDVHVAVLADVEVVVDHLGKAGLADDDGDVALLALCAGLDADDDAALALRLGDDLNMLGGLAGLAAAVLTDVERADGLAREVGDLFQKAGVRYRST